MGDFHGVDGRAGEGLILADALPKVPAAKRTALWLVFLGPFFYTSYGLSNYLASLRASVPDVAMDWEQAIPFMEWTIIPYWSINLFYVATLFFSGDEAEVDRTAKRYLTCQIIAVFCFILFPLRAIFVKPETSGLTGFMFDALGSFDKPFNQAPSLHIALLVIIWDHWRGRLCGWGLRLWHVWSAMIGLSVLTTFQHHVMDIPTGALLGLFALWLFQGGNPAYAKVAARGKKRLWKVGRFYAIGAAMFLCLAIFSLRLTPLSLLWIWPAISLALVAAAYFGLGVSVFQKRTDGAVSLASYLLLMPYRWGARINAWAWTRRLPPSVQVSANVWLGRIPKESEINGFSAVIDMTGEMPVPKLGGVEVKAFPMLDLAAPPIQTLRRAAQAIQKTQENGKVLVCCALGMQRSAAAVAVWLVSAGHAADGAEAIAIVRRTGRPVHLEAALVDAALEERP